MSHSLLCIKVSKFQNEFVNLWSHRFSKNTNKKLSGFLPCVVCTIVRAEILTIFCSYFGRNDGFTNSFWNLLTFSVSNVMIIEYDNSSHVAIDKWDAFKSLDCFVYGWQLFWNFLNHYAIFLYFWMKVLQCNVMHMKTILSFFLNQ